MLRKGVANLKAVGLEEVAGEEVFVRAAAGHGHRECKPVVLSGHGQGVEGSTPAAGTRGAAASNLWSNGGPGRLSGRPAPRKRDRESWAACPVHGMKCSPMMCSCGFQANRCKKCRRREAATWHRGGQRFRPKGELVQPTASGFVWIVEVLIAIMKVKATRSHLKITLSVFMKASYDPG